MPDDVSYCKNGNSGSIRSLVFEKLNENPLLTAKNLCKLLDLPYPQYRNYVAKLRHEWKYYARAVVAHPIDLHACIENRERERTESRLCL